MYQRRNESPDFVGLEVRKKKHKEQLKQDNEFIERFLRGVELLMLSWGGDLYGDLPEIKG